MKVVTLNVNGIVNAAERGLLEWLEQLDADVVCLQDTKVKHYTLPDKFLEVPGYNAYFFDAEQDDHAGTAIYCRAMPKAIIYGFGNPQYDLEGGFIQADFDNVSVASVWIPKAQWIEDVDYKLEYLEAFQQHLKRTRRKRRDFIFAGSYQVAHRSVDLGNWEEHQREPGFLPEERAWMDQVLGPIGFVDAFRQVNRQDRQHTFWPFDEAQANGSRIDYQLITPNLGDFVVDSKIIREPRLSPHCPVMVEYDLDL
ncbi:exodeoxyribonuclease III [Reinekea thalattae]|uniref:Exodeoxyribonuclease III n=1 Tax=Reinekea thalattae TaxID=2593301 RepID=A0A5C8ZBK4_9GAMM|nr:exodeoxyribonuclease III [Reinekea thalattae]TXR54578.1 exodeoxyribonuclease III [Reinekea thalattae]